jgi:hypothetical protein
MQRLLGWRLGARSARAAAAALVLASGATGGFANADNLAVGISPHSVAVGDFNGDGKPDLAVANDTPFGTVSVLLGEGDGRFRQQRTYAAGKGSDSVAVGDFNGDGKPDLVVADNGGGVSVLLNDGAGFASPVRYGAGTSPVSVGDFNGDGKPDLAVANYGSNTISILLGNGNGTFQAQTTRAAGTNPFALAVGDFNGDRRPDLAVANDALSGTVSVLLRP